MDRGEKLYCALSFSSPKDKFKLKNNCVTCYPKKKLFKDKYDHIYIYANSHGYYKLDVRINGEVLTKTLFSIKSVVELYQKILRIKE